jgi:rhomboid domain-containing protein 1
MSLSNSGAEGSSQSLVVDLVEKIFHQLGKSGHKSPVTCLLLLCNILPHVLPIKILRYNLKDVKQNAVHPRSVVNVWRRKNKILWNRVVLSAFMHGNDTHLYYNMLSLLWKGVLLEKSLGSIKFLLLVIYSVLCSNAVEVIMSYLLNELNLDFIPSYYDTYSIGFSGVLFALKYILNLMSPNSIYQYDIGDNKKLKVQSKYVAWFELVLISLTTPNVSFLGHLSGIFAGLLAYPFVSKTRRF